MKTDSLAAQFAEREGQFDVDLRTVHHFAGGVYAKEMRLPAGYEATSHVHRYDHLSILAAGMARVATDATGSWRETVYTAPAVIEIKAGWHHRITALEDVTWLCIHRTDETDESKIDSVLIAREGAGE